MSESGRLLQSAGRIGRQVRQSSSDTCFCRKTVSIWCRGFFFGRGDRDRCGEGDCASGKPPGGKRLAEKDTVLWW